MKSTINLIAILTILSNLCAVVSATDRTGTLAGPILDASGVEGGLVVAVGCQDPDLLAALRACDSYLVQGLDTDPGAIDKARRHIQGTGLYGAVTVDTWDGKHLPYRDNIINLLIFQEDQEEVTDDEILRVLAPRGVALVRIVGDSQRKRGSSASVDIGGTQYVRLVKPVPDTIDDWTHFLHGPDHNACAKDSEVGFPRHLQWQSHPVWARHHDTIQSVEAIVSANGRLFMVFDEVKDSVLALPDEWVLLARDAFSGVPLWKKSMNDFGWKAWSEEVMVGRNANPKQMHRRLVAVGDRVYVTLGFNAPVSVLDGATGEVITTYEETENTTELICYQDRLFLAIKKQAGHDASHVFKALDLATGNILWESAEYGSGWFPADFRIMAGENRLFFMEKGDGRTPDSQDRVIALDMETGRAEWSYSLFAGPDEDGESASKGRKKRANTRRPALANASFIYHAGAVYVLSPAGQLEAISAETGKLLWSGKHGAKTFGTVFSALFVAQDLLWTHGAEKFAFVGLDPATGEVKRTIDLTDAATASVGHMRCYPAKATEDTLWTTIGGKPQQVVDLVSGENSSMPWLRAGCRIGVLPCNGLSYITPHPCACYIEVKLNGMLAMASDQSQVEDADTGPRLEKGPAFGKIVASRDDTNAWPMYRHDPARSGMSNTTAPANLKRAWSANIGGQLTQPVIAEGRVFLASTDSHTVHGLDAATGKSIWSYTCGGRVDTSPTLHRGKILFGSADGYVYCLDAAQGTLAWRFRAAPCDRRMFSFGQLESVWPVHGTVLVKDNKAVIAAGRTSYLDGGMYLYVLDPDTGKVLNQHQSDETGNRLPINPPPGLLSDVLVSDQEAYYMHMSKITIAEDGIEVIPKAEPQKGGPGVPRSSQGQVLISADLMFRDIWFHRTGLLFGTTRGQAIVGDRNSAYAYQAFSRWGHRTTFVPGIPESGQLLAIDGASGRPTWTINPSIMIKAMVLTPDTIIAAGAPNVFDEEDPSSVIEGRKKSRVIVYSRSDGSQLGECEIPYGPVFDGMAAASGKLFISLKNGELVCLK